MGVLDFVTTSAVSLVVGGNTGINPCLTLFLVGCIERINPELLNMEGTMEDLLSSWPSIVVLGIFTILEFIGNCVPVLDQVIDSIMAFVIPIFSVLGSLSTFGLFNEFTSDSSSSSGGDGRMLAADGSGALVFFQVILVICGVGLALCLHLFKMLVRLLGEGCLTGLLTAMEVTWTFCVITVVIFIKPIAIIVAVVLLWAAALAIKRKFYDKKKEAAITLDEDADVVVVEEGYVSMEAGEGNKGGEDRPISPIVKEEDDIVVIEQKSKDYKSME